MPPDRGLGEVRQQLAARGQSLPDDADDQRQRKTAALLAEPLTEAAAVQLAFLNSPVVEAEYARLGLSGADLLDAGRLRNPTLSGAVLFPLSGGDANRYDLGLTQSLVELLLLPARTRFSQGEFERVKLEATQRLTALATDVQAAYYGAVSAKQVVAMRRTLAAAASASAELTARYKAAGNVTALELAVDQASASQAQLDLEQAQAASVAAEAQLNQTMGLAVDAEWEVTDSLAAPVAHEDEADALQDLARRQRADLEADRRAVALLEDSLGVTRRYRFLGDVEVGAQYERDTDRSRLLGPSLSLQIPIFNQGQAPILRAQAQLDGARAALHAKEIEVGNAVQLAQDRVMAARRRAERLSTETIPLREAIVARTQERVDFMLVGVFDALRARQEEYAAYQQYLEAVRDYWLARVELAKAVGSRLPSDTQVGAAVIAPDYPVQPRDDTMNSMNHSMGGMTMPGMDHGQGAATPGPSGDSTQDVPGMAGMDMRHAPAGKPPKAGLEHKSGKAAAPRPASPAPLPHHHPATPDPAPAPTSAPLSLPEHLHGDTP